MDRKATIECVDGTYNVHCYQNDVLVMTVELEGKSIYFAEDTAENWENGILKAINKNI